ncbi:MAG: hypothetical protein ACM3H9_10455, partial [Rhodospirillaceae bacterium]
MRRWVAVLFAIAVCAGSEDPASTSPRSPQASGTSAGPRTQAGATPAPWLARLSSYLEAVNEHTPGTADMAAHMTGFMGEADLYEARTDFLALVALCKREISRSVRSASIAYRNTTIPYPELRKVLTLTD